MHADASTGALAASPNLAGRIRATQRALALEVQPDGCYRPEVLTAR
jgi:hypothetical protein